MIKIEKQLFGTREWAEKNINFIDGCLHNCKYCYSKEMAIRFGRKTSRTWKYEKVRMNVVNRPFPKYKGTIMFPSSHDITPLNLDKSIKLLSALLSAGNKVLIVSKPHRTCIEALCSAFVEYKGNILFRFSIGSSSDEILKFWEPSAPKFQERLQCLKYAFEQGYSTSISCEPMLDSNIEDVVRKVQPYVTDFIWIGKANFLLRRLRMNGVLDKRTLIKAKQLIEDQNYGNIVKLYNSLSKNPKIKWKESISKLFT